MVVCTIDESVDGSIMLLEVGEYPHALKELYEEIQEEAGNMKGRIRKDKYMISCMNHQKSRSNRF